ncbi:MAG: hypothetical protein SF051_10235 [Elusimicrobiota bacterium]|nr:hypothetical protein [Elusimicrobiota bacterium]
MSKEEDGAQGRSKRTRENRPFPACSFEEALVLARAIHKFSSGKPIRRLTLFDQLGKSPESGPSRQLITNSAKYGLTKGSYAAEQIELTPAGATASSDDAPVRERARAQVKLAVLDIPVFKPLYEKFVGNKLPSKPVLIDSAKELNLSSELAEEAVDTFIVNLKFIGLLKTLSGAERIISQDHLLDSLPATQGEATSTPVILLSAPSDEDKKHEPESKGSYDICFYLTPIGEDGSEVRKHSDLFLGSLVEPAIEPFKLKVVRADKIEKPGMITKQIIENLVRAKLVIADLSYHNPNVFYELAIRHAMRLPTVQVIRSQDKIPFDVGGARTIQIDCTDIYSLVPKLETFRAEIANQARRALEEKDASDNPVSVFYPDMKISVGGQFSGA